MQAKEHYLITALYDTEFPSVSIINQIAGYFKIPYIWTPDDLCFPESENENEYLINIPADLVEMIAQNAVYSFLTERPDRRTCCKLHLLCQKEYIVDGNCCSEPWKHEKCLFTVVSDYLHLSEKIVPG